ncbi:butyrophilin subfamily 2 member A2-like [Nematolebias whitei]|uniref:butyrophilin subfamily 2 member A2-like n=1 Tax=Nematolebias whitei TaxID=451745 RepID=UPI001899EAC8|nr:butyrophilin subfamily 2 member A2-like [Nematolebias whitei]
MGLVNLLWCLVFLLSPCLAAPVSEHFAVMVGPPVSVQRGLTATLPCWLHPSRSAEDMEVLWHRGSDQYDTPVMHFKSKMFQLESQKALYAGRVDFGFKDTASGGLKAGDVSLKLLNVTIEDAGNYTCYVSSSTDYDSSSVSLHVTETGTPPILSAVWKGDMVNVSCESEGWYPQPELHWSDRNKDLINSNLVYTKDLAGLFSVHSWLLVPDSSEVSCFVGLSKEETKQARMRLGSPKRSQQEASGSSPAGWVAFGILLALAVAVAAALYFKKQAESKPEGDQTEETKPLMSKGMKQPTSLSVASKCYANVKLVDTNNQFVAIKESLLRDSLTIPDGNRVTCLTAVRGTPGFSSGQHYWEVLLSRPSLDPKKSWWIGVTNKPEIPQDASFSPNTSNGFWFLSSSPNREEMVQFSTEPEVVIHLQSRPKVIGVFLDYDSGELSFYSVEEERLIGSLAATFTGEVFPVFNPGKGDQIPMEIFQKAKQDLARDLENFMNE